MPAGGSADPWTVVLTVRRRQACDKDRTKGDEDDQYPPTTPLSSPQERPEPASRNRQQAIPLMIMECVDGRPRPSIGPFRAVVRVCILPVALRHLPGRFREIGSVDQAAKGRISTGGNSGNCSLEQE